MQTILAAENVATGSELLAPGMVRMDGGLISDVTSVVPAGVEVRPGYLVPGFVDIHTHGGGGATVVGGEREAVETFVRTHLEHGTTTICASLVSAHREPLLEDVKRLAVLVEEGLIAGVHLEGPWIAPAMKGAHDPTALRPPAPDELDDIVDAARGTVHMVTLAPELEHGMEAVRRFAEHGALSAFGHSDADWQTTRECIDAGSIIATHLFNQMRGIHHREPGPIPALMADPRMHVELIADGIHVHPAVIAMVRQAVPKDRILLVTDAMSATGQPDGRYMLGDLEVEVADGVARLVSNGALAGSTLTMDSAFRRVVSECGFSIEEAVLAASVTPSRLINRTDIGSLAAGMKADIVVLDENLGLQQVWKDGETIR